MHASAHARILVVNDDPASLLALTSLLEGWADALSYRVHAAASGEEALRAVLRHDFAVILLDVNMPGMDGFETAQAIHGHPRSKDVPIIFVTAYQADDLARLKAYQQGAADFLFTPVIPQILHAKIAVFIALGQKNEQLRAQAAKLGERTDKLTVINARLVQEMEERAAAERANDAKDEFLAMLAHELRNPLAAIGSASGLLGMPSLAAPTAVRVRDIIQRQSRQLSAIVDDLLDLSRARSGKIVLARRPVELAALVRTCIETFAAAGRTAAHRLTHDLAPCWVDGDPTRLEQIAANLIDNAVKYTPAGGAIHVTVGPEEGMAVLAVRDDGVGIAPDLLPQVFDLFVQEGRARDRAQGGLGIGLALVRKLTTLHGGTVEVHSAGQGCGSAFTVRLAATPAAADVAAPRPADRLAGRVNHPARGRQRRRPRHAGAGARSRRLRRPPGGGRTARHRAGVRVSAPRRHRRHRPARHRRLRGGAAPAPAGRHEGRAARRAHRLRAAGRPRAGAGSGVRPAPREAGRRRRPRRALRRSRRGGRGAGVKGAGVYGFARRAAARIIAPFGARAPFTRAVKRETHGSAGIAGHQGVLPPQR